MAGPGLWAGPEASILEVLRVTQDGDPMCLDAQSPVSTLQPLLSFLELAQELPETGTSHPPLCSPTIISGSWYLDPGPR